MPRPLTKLHKLSELHWSLTRIKETTMITQDEKENAADELLIEALKTVTENTLLYGDALTVIVAYRKIKNKDAYKAQ